MKTSHLAVVVLALFFAGLNGGCAIGPDYQRPELPGLESFRADLAGTADKASGSYGDLGWRSVYVDPPLQALIE